MMPRTDSEPGKVRLLAKGNLEKMPCKSDYDKTTMRAKFFEPTCVINALLVSLSVFPAPFIEDVFSPLYILVSFIVN